MDPTRGYGSTVLPFIGALFLLTWGTLGCSELFTEAPSDDDLLDAPLPGLTPGEQAAFLRGDEEFGRAFSVGDGVGPLFNNTACAACHSGDGRGRPENALTRFGGDPGSPLPGEPQLQDRAIPGVDPERVPEGAALSVRLPPPVFGVGLIEAIPEASILAGADPTDADGDGVSGRAHLVIAPDWIPQREINGGTAPRVGRFSRKAQVSTLLQQIVEAYHQDMGITSDFLPEENTGPDQGASTKTADRVPDPEIPESTVRAVLDYVRMLAPPAPAPDDAEIDTGRALFTQVGCAVCHTPSFTTGPHPISAVADQEVLVYSDFLLHDMGPDLADGRPDRDASGSEWRTTPLWGLRVMRDFLNGDAFLMHDGRAESVEEAILQHGGEALGSVTRFEVLEPADRAALVRFVETR